MKGTFDHIIVFWRQKEKRSPMKSHWLLKSGKITRVALRSFKKRERDVSCMWRCINMTGQLK